MHLLQDMAWADYTNYVEVGWQTRCDGPGSVLVGLASDGLHVARRLSDRRRARMLQEHGR